MYSANNLVVLSFRLLFILRLSPVGIRDADALVRGSLPLGDHIEFVELKFVAPECLRRVQECLPLAGVRAPSVDLPLIVLGLSKLGRVPLPPSGAPRNPGATAESLAMPAAQHSAHWREISMGGIKKGRTLWLQD